MSKDIKDVHSQKTSSGLETNKMPKDIKSAHCPQPKKKIKGEKRSNHGDPSPCSNITLTTTKDNIRTTKEVLQKQHFQEKTMHKRCHCPFKDLRFSTYRKTVFPHKNVFNKAVQPIKAKPCVLTIEIRGNCTFHHVLFRALHISPHGHDFCTFHHVLF
jgi:hypothetical protein